MSRKDKARRKKALERKAKGELKRQLLSYSIAAGAALIGAQAARAGIIYSGPQTITVDSENTSVSINMDGAGGAEFNFTWDGTVSTDTYMTATTGGGTATVTYTSYWRNMLYIVPVASGSVAGSSWPPARLVGSQDEVNDYLDWDGGSTMRTLATASYTTYNGSFGSFYSYGNFAGAKGFIGVWFDDDDMGKYGWIEFEGAGDASWGKITGWAYESSGGPIHAGATEGGDPLIPEPGGLALLATGAAGLMAFRKKRKE